MASERRGRANRENARKSTGPRSRAGRRHSSRNARKHGLTVPLWSLPEVRDFVEKLADEIAGAQSTQEIRRAARAAAEAYFELLRVDRAVASLFDRLQVIGTL